MSIWSNVSRDVQTWQIKTHPTKPQEQVHRIFVRAVDHYQHSARLYLPHAEVHNRGPIVWVSGYLYSDGLSYSMVHVVNTSNLDNGVPCTCQSVTLGVTLIPIAIRTSHGVVWRASPYTMWRTLQGGFHPCRTQKLLQHMRDETFGTSSL